MMKNGQKVDPLVAVVGSEQVGVFQIGSDDSMFTNQKVYIWNHNNKTYYFSDIYGSQEIDVISPEKFVQKSGLASWSYENNAWTVTIDKPIPSLKLNGGEQFKFDRTDKGRALPGLPCDKEQVAFIENDVGFGLLNLAKFGADRGRFCLLFPVTYLAQFTIISTLSWDEYSNATSGICPNEATGIEKLIAISMSALYCLRCIFLVLQFKDTISEKGEHKKIIPGYLDGRTGGLCTMVDCISNMAVLAMATYFNMWIIYSTKDPLDIVLSGLAMEFIAVFDEEINAQYMKRYPKTYDNIKDSCTKGASKCEQLFGCYFFLFHFIPTYHLLRAAIVLSPFVAVANIPYLITRIVKLRRQ